MSSPLALAAVTALLKDLLNEGLINRDLGNIGNFSVTSKPLDRVITDADADQLNVFLYQVTPNLGWRNADLPSRSDRGERITNPTLALDLHYLITACGTNDFNAEILLGYAMHLLHETPVLPRQTIRSALAPTPPTPPVTSGILPPAPSRFADLPAADLADQIEQIKITPQFLSTEEMSKIWTGFQTHYRLSAAYLVTTVLVQSTTPTRSPLPVLTRGGFDPVLQREEGVIVQPNLLPPFPTLLETEPPNKQSALRMGETLSLQGHHLAGDQVVARFMEPRTETVLQLLAETGPSDTDFQVKIPSDPAAVPVPSSSPLNPDNWQAGVYRVAAVVRRTGLPDRVSNEMAVAVAPTITTFPIAVTVNGVTGVVTMTVKCSPKIRTTQRVTLIVADREIIGQPLLVNPTDTQTDSITFSSPGLASGSYPVRLRVDGVESILVDRSLVPPQFVPSQKVIIP